jgi:hypothetical protein
VSCRRSDRTIFPSRESACTLRQGTGEVSRRTWRGSDQVPPLRISYAVLNINAAVGHANAIPGVDACGIGRYSLENRTRPITVILLLHKLDRCVDGADRV